MQEKSKQSFWQVVGRGVLGKCPHCGEGKLFKSYLKQVDECAECGEKLGHIRADDGPAWLTVLLTGHISAFVMMFGVPNITLPDWAIFGLATSIILSLTLVILPRAKGLFISFIWRVGCEGSK